MFNVFWLFVQYGEGTWTSYYPPPSCFWADSTKAWMPTVKSCFSNLLYVHLHNLDIVIFCPINIINKQPLFSNHFLKIPLALIYYS